MTDPLVSWRDRLRLAWWCLTAQQWHVSAVDGLVCPLQTLDAADEKVKVWHYDAIFDRDGGGVGTLGPNAEQE